MRYFLVASGMVAPAAQARDDAKDDVAEHVAVAANRSNRGIAFHQNGGRRGWFPLDRAILSIARVLLSRHDCHRHHAIDSERGLDRFESALSRRLK
jgi:hypothetical protein